MKALLGGEATGEVLVLEQPLSLWGGFDAETGEVIDRRHPQAGAVLTGRVVVMPSGRGSSSSASVLAEAIRSGTAPAAIVLRESDDIILLGALVAELLYAKVCPVLVAGEEEYARMVTGAMITVSG